MAGIKDLEAKGVSATRQVEMFEEIQALHKQFTATAAQTRFEFFR